MGFSVGSFSVLMFMMGCIQGEYKFPIARLLKVFDPVDIAPTKDDCKSCYSPFQYMIRLEITEACNYRHTMKIFIIVSVVTFKQRGTISSPNLGMNTLSKIPR